MCHDAREDTWGVVVDQEEVDGLGAGGEESFCKKGINQPKIYTILCTIVN